MLRPTLKIGASAILALALGLGGCSKKPAAPVTAPANPLDFSLGRERSGLPVQPPDQQQGTTQGSPASPSQQRDVAGAKTESLNGTETATQTQTPTESAPAKKEP